MPGHHLCFPLTLSNVLSEFKCLVVHLRNPDVQFTVWPLSDLWGADKGLAMKTVRFGPIYLNNGIGDSS